jgi:hypothetical protein
VIDCFVKRPEACEGESTGSCDVDEARVLVIWEIIGDGSKGIGGEFSTISSTDEVALEAVMRVKMKSMLNRISVSVEIAATLNLEGVMSEVIEFGAEQGRRAVRNERLDKGLKTRRKDRKGTRSSRPTLGADWE